MLDLKKMTKEEKVDFFVRYMHGELSLQETAEIEYLMLEYVDNYLENHKKGGEGNGIS